MAEKNEEMRGLLNAGHQRNRYVTRVVGNDHTPHKFATFAMAAIAGIGDLPDTVMDRSVVIRMRRRAEGEKVKPFRSRRDIPALHDLRDRIAAWARPLLDEAANLEPDMPVEDRAADTWEPLVIVADLAGGPWPRLARAGVRADGRRRSGGRGGPPQRRADPRRHPPGLRRPARGGQPVHRGTPPPPAPGPRGPWAEWGRGGLTARELGRMLRDFDIRPGNVRMADGTQRKGYTRNKFLDAWRRYCPTVHPVDADPARRRGLSPAALVAVLAVPAVISQVKRPAAKTATGAKTATRSRPAGAARPGRCPDPSCAVLGVLAVSVQVTAMSVETEDATPPSRLGTRPLRAGLRRDELPEPCCGIAEDADGTRRDGSRSRCRTALTCACNGQDGKDAPHHHPRSTPLDHPSHLTHRITSRRTTGRAKDGRR